MLNTLTALLKDEEGASMVEYSLVVALIAGICVAVTILIGGQVKTLLTGTNTSLTSANTAAGN